RRGADRVPHLVLEEDHHARAQEDRGLREAGGRLAKELAAQDLERVKGDDRIQLRQRRGAPAGGVVAGLFLALEQEDVGHASIGTSTPATHRRSARWIMGSKPASNTIRTRSSLA